MIALKKSAKEGVCWAILRLGNDFNEMTNKSYSIFQSIYDVYDECGSELNLVLYAL